MKSSFRMFAAAAALVAVTLPQSVLASGAQASKGSAPPAATKASDERTRVNARATALDDWATALTVEMNKATGQAKIDAMERLLSALVQHRSMMLEEIKMMQDDLDAQHEAMQRMMYRGTTGTSGPSK